MNPQLALLLLLLLVPHFAVAQELGTLTLREGGLRLIRGTAVLQPAEGMRLQRGDILESADTAFVQLEFEGGSIVALGPSTRLYVLSHSGRSGTELVLLSGWLKGQTSSGAGAYRYLNPLLTATTRDGTLVLHAGPDATEVFVESGSASIGEEHRGGSSGGKAGQFYSRSVGKNVAAASRMPAHFISSMPQQFKDTLPSRLSRFTGKHPEPRRDHEVSYSEVQSWLTMPVAWRRGLAVRFESRLHDPAFRRSVENHLPHHPEWDPILHPDKYQHKTAPTSADSASAQHGSNPQ